MILLENAALRLASTPPRIEQYVAKTAPNIAHNIFRNTIIKTGIQYGMTMRQLAKLQIRSNENEIDIHLKYWGSVRGDRLRQRWFVKPKEKKALHWTIGGTNFFSKGHWVSGVDGRWVINRAVKLGLAKFQRTLQDSIENFLEVTRLW